MLVIAACGGKQAAIGHDGPGAAPAGPVPTLGFVAEDGDYGSFKWTGLPAIAVDGSTIVLPIDETNRPPGFPNLTLEARDRSDHTISKHVVLATSGDDGEPQPPGDLAGGNAWLAAQHQAHPLAPLPLLGEHHTSFDEEGPTSVSSGTLVVTWDAGHLNVRDGGAVVVDAQHPDWLAPTHPLCPDCEETCANPSYLGRVHGDVARHVLLVEIGYHGTDSCWEPNPETHVVAW